MNIMTQTQIAWYRQNQMRQSLLHAMYMQMAAGAGNSRQPTPPPPPPQNDKLKLVVQTTSNHRKTGIYSAERDDTSKPVVIDWGDGTVEEIDGDVSQKVHEYTSTGTFNMTIENIKSYAAANNSSWSYDVQNTFTLKEVVIPTRITSIGNNAFNNCNILTSVTIPDSVTSIGDYAFYRCTGITSITIPDSITSIGAGVLRGCTGLTSVTIPDSVTSIGNAAFDGCSGLTSVTIPDSVTDIGYQAFSQCSGLKTVTIGNGVTSIGAAAFLECTSLMSVTIGGGVTSIGESAFDGCSGLMSFTVDDGNANYKSVNGLLLSKDGKTLIKGVNGDVTIPESVTSIEQWAFDKCSSLENLSFAGDNVPAGGFECFCDIANLTDIYMMNVSQSEVMSQLDSNIKDWGLGICHIDGKITYYAVTIHCKADETGDGIVIIDPTPSGSGS